MRKRVVQTFLDSISSGFVERWDRKQTDVVIEVLERLRQRSGPGGRCTTCAGASRKGPGESG